jgi:hypothetical protein
VSGPKEEKGRGVAVERFEFWNVEWFGGGVVLKIGSERRALPEVEQWRGLMLSVQKAWVC